MINIIVDKFEENGKPAANGISADEYHLDYPRLYYYLHQCKIPVSIVHIDTAPLNSWYLMVLGFFDHECDYFNLIPAPVYKRLQCKEIKVVFTYHEGDNPRNIRMRLDYWCDQHGIEPSLVWLISGNSSADAVFNCAYWSELEFMYWRSVDLRSGGILHKQHRSKQYMALCRIDKIWRNAFMSTLWAKGLHQQGYFSYNQIDLGNEDDYYGCALNNEYLEELQPQMDAFITAGPFRADELDTKQHNTYAVNPENMYEDSYFNIVLETVLDTDNSGGAFVTEKTFKPIFNNQFFVQVASAGTLAHLRDLGYQTFGMCIDEHYDTIVNHQERFDAVLELTCDLISQDLHSVYTKLSPVIRHNHHVFKQGMAHRLQAVVDCISCKQ